MRPRLTRCPTTLDKSLEPAGAPYRMNHLLLLPVGHDRQGISAVTVGAIDQIAGAGIARVVVDKPVFAPMLADGVSSSRAAMRDRRAVSLLLSELFSRQSLSLARR